ncbi:MAG: hypothetical protein K2V38_27180, partial [Gemmataceae bacterium]|nr:hypothetical protein [Gemmataceae bacterium]
VLKEMVDPTAKLYPTPNTPKKVGDTWERKANLPLGPIGSYEVTYKCKYAGVEKEKDKIEVETAIVYTAPTAKDSPDGLLFRIKEGSKLTSVTEKDASKGFILYDPKTRRVESAEINIKLKGDLVVVIGGSDTKVELNQEQKTIIKTQETSFVNVKPVTPPVPDPKPPEPKPIDPKPPQKP